jgi:hypothetical protein
MSRSAGKGSRIACEGAGSGLAAPPPPPAAGSGRATAGERRTTAAASVDAAARRIRFGVRESGAERRPLASGRRFGIVFFFRGWK